MIKGYEMMNEMRRREFCEGTVATATMFAVGGLADAVEPPKKVKASRNRTLTISNSEIPLLEERIVKGEDLKTGFKDDMIVNSDILSCVDTIPDAYFDLVILDPPYNLDKNFNGRKFSSLPEKEYEEYLRSWFYKLCEKLKPNGSLYMCGDWKCTSAMQRVIGERLHILNRITWQREKGRGAKHNWKNGMEDVWFAVKDPNDYYFNVDAVMVKRKVIAPYRENGKPKDWEESESGNFRKTYPSNFWDDITIPFWSMPENTDHPTQKPEKLFAKLVLASSRVGDRVFDPFLGSGTTAVVSKKLDRRFCGVEINHEYCLWAAKRVIVAESNKEIQGYSDGVFWERNSLPEQKRAEAKQFVEQSLFGGANE